MVGAGLVFTSQNSPLRGQESVQTPCQGAEVRGGADEWALCQVHVRVLLGTSLRPALLCGILGQADKTRPGGPPHTQDILFKISPSVPWSGFPATLLGIPKITNKPASVEVNSVSPRRLGTIKTVKPRIPKMMKKRKNRNKRAMAL